MMLSIVANLEKINSTPKVCLRPQGPNCAPEPVFGICSQMWFEFLSPLCSLPGWPWMQ